VRALLRALGLVLRLLVLLVVVALVVTAVRVVLVGGDDQRRASDVVVVLGAAQLDGTPGEVLQARLEHALELHRDGVAPVVLTTGGAAEGDRFTEGGSGRQWLLEHGLDDGEVVAVEVGDDTSTSLEAAAEVMRGRGWDSAVVVTDRPHLLRSVSMLQAEGVDAVGSAAPRGPGGWWLTVRYVARVTGAYLWWQLERLVR
jgi:uncharacterized SAM-binding protein YcdF (DUF218 family)